MSRVEKYLRHRYDGYQSFDVSKVHNELMLGVAASIKCNSAIRDLLDLKRLPRDTTFSKEDFFTLVELLVDEQF